MVYKPKTNGEFSGGPGLVQPEQQGHEDEVQSMWEVYSTDPGRSDAPGQPLASNLEVQPHNPNDDAPTS